MVGAVGGSVARSPWFPPVAEAASGVLLLCAGRALAPWAFAGVAGAGGEAGAIHAAVSPGNISTGVVLGLLVLLVLVPGAGLLTGFGGAGCVRCATGGRLCAPAWLGWAAAALVVGWAALSALSLLGVVDADMLVLGLAFGFPTGVPWAFLAVGFCGGMAVPRRF